MKSDISVTDDGKLQIDLRSIIDALTPQARYHLLISASMDDFLVEAMVRFLTTEYGYWTDDFEYSFSHDFAAKMREQLWKRISANIDDVVRERVRDLLTEVAKAKHYQKVAEDRHKCLSAAWRYACPECGVHIGGPPLEPPWTPWKKVEDNEVNAVVEQTQ